MKTTYPSDLMMKTKGMFTPFLAAVLGFAGCDPIGFDNDQQRCGFAFEIAAPVPEQLTVGQEQTVTARRVTVPERSCRPVRPVYTWRSDDPAVATVTATGDSTAVVRAVGTGTTLVRAESVDKVGIQTAFQVQVQPASDGAAFSAR